MSELHALANHVSCSREDFAHVFELVRGSSKVSTHPFMMQVMGLPVGDDQIAFSRAFNAADADGWLEGLVSNLTRFRYLTHTAKSGSSTTLQDFINPASGFQDPALMRTALPKRMSQVCLIDINNEESTGSGFLIGPNAVLTNWHVIHRLLDQDSCPEPGSDKKIKVRFDHVSGSGTVQVFNVCKEWLLHHSPCHSSEVKQAGGVTTTDFGSEALVGYLDFAIIALTSCPGNERGFVSIADAVSPKQGSAGYVLQHPEAFEQKMAQGDFEGFRPGTHQQRLLYTINTLKGSSGGMIVDSEFNFVGLHQGAIPDVIDGQAMNTGIAASAIHAAAGIGHETPDPTAVLQFRRLNNTGPIIGRKNCHAWINQCLLGTKKIIRIHAGEGIKGTSFSRKIMIASLPGTDHRIIRISAGQLPLSSQEVAAFLMEKMGIESDTLPDPKTAETADPDWIKTTLFPHFRDRVNEKCADGVKQWLVIDNIDKESIPDTGVRRFLDVLYSEIEKIPELRIVLIGLKEKLIGVNSAIEHDEKIEDPSQEDISRYIRMRYTDSQIEFDYHGGEVVRLADLVERSASRKIEQLDKYMQNIVDDMIDDTVSGR